MTTTNTGVELLVYLKDGVTKYAYIPRFAGFSGMDEMASGAGANIFQVLTTDQQLIDYPKLLDYRNIVYILVNGVIVNAMIIQNKKTIVVDTSTGTDTYVEVSGEGLRTWFNDAELYPEKGLYTFSYDTRYFSPGSEYEQYWKNSGQWIAPVVGSNYIAKPPASGAKPWDGNPQGWPPQGTNAKWIWWTPYGIGQATGTMWARRTFFIGAQATFVLWAAADDNFEAYVDGQLVLTGTDFRQTQTVQFTIPAGNHVLAFKVNNVWQVGGVIAQLSQVGTNGLASGDFLHTGDGNAAWSVTNGVNLTSLAWTPGAVLAVLLYEATTRGVRFASLLTQTFTKDHDSYGHAWVASDFLDWSFNVGDNYTAVISQIEAVGYEVWIDPAAMTINIAAARGASHTAGNGATDAVILSSGKNLLQADTSGQSNMVNVVLTKSSDGWVETVDTNTQHLIDYGRLEGSLSLTTDGTMAAKISSLTINNSSSTQVGSTYTIVAVPGATPKVDFDTGDWVLAPDENGNSVPRRVMSLTVTADDAGNPIWACEFDTIFQELDIRLQNYVNQITNGTVSSSSSSSGNTVPNNPTRIGVLTPSIPSLDQAPAAPTGLACAMTLGFNSVGTPVVAATISWTAVTQSVLGLDTSVTSYQVWGINQSAANPVPYLLATPAGGATQATITDLAYGATWQFYVVAVSSANITSPNSANLTQTLNPAIPVLTAPTAPTLAAKLGIVSVAWDGNLATSPSPTAPPVQFDHTNVMLSTSLAGSPSRTNQCLNPVPTTTSGYSGPGTTSVTTMSDGTPCFQVTTTTVTTPYAFSAKSGVVANSGETWVVSAVVEVIGDTAGTVYAVRAHGVTGNVYFASGAQTYTAGSGPVRVSVVSTLNANVLAGDFGFSVVGPNAKNGVSVRVGDVLIEKANSFLGYFDGGTAMDGYYSYSWSGGANASASLATAFSPFNIVGQNLLVAGQVVLPNLTVGSTYYVQLVAADKLGNFSAPSATKAITVIGVATPDLDASVQTAITNAQTAATNAQTSANGKNTVYYSSTAPTVPVSGASFTVNDVWFNTGSGNAISYWNGSSWTSSQLGTNAIANASITNAQIANVDAGKITTGFLAAARIQADTITSPMLLIGDFTNLAAGSDFEGVSAANPWTLGAAWSVDTAQHNSGTKSLKCTGTLTGVATLGTVMAVQAAAQYYVEFYVYRDASWNGTTAGSFLRFVDQASTVAGTFNYDSTSIPATTWTKVSGTLTVPSGSTSLTVTLNTNATAGNLWIDDVTIRLKNTGNLIVDGTITASKIAANTITASQIAANTISATQLAAGAIDGFIITGATLQTAASGQRVVIDSTGFKGYDSSGTNVVTSVSTAGILTATGATITGTLQTGTSGQRAVMTGTGLTFYQPSGSVGGSINAAAGGGAGSLLAINASTGSGQIILGTNAMPATGSADISLSGTTYAPILYTGPEGVRIPAIYANSYADATSIAAGTSHNTTVTFPTNTFATAPFCIIMTASNARFTCAPSSITATGFIGTAANWSTGTGTPGTIYYVAFGL